MKILYPIGSFYPSQSGGPNNTIYWITQALCSRKITPIIVTTNQGILSEHKIVFNSWLEKDYGKVVYIKTLIHYFPIKSFFTTLKKISQVDVIHLTAIFYPLSWSILIINHIFFRKKIVWSPRGELDDKAIIYSTWKKKPILWMLNMFFKKGIIFHATCAEEKKYIRKHFGVQNKIIIVPNYIKLPELLYCEKKKYFLYLGRIHPKKAIENLIEAFCKSKEIMNSEFELKIAGNYDNSYGKSLIEKVKQLKADNYIKFLGHIEGEEKQKTLAEAYCLVMPSHTENFGNVVVEALAQKTPVIASKGTPWELLKNRKAGYWVLNDIQSLVKSLERMLLIDDSEYLQMSNNAYSLAINEFDINNRVGNWISFYKNLND